MTKLSDALTAANAEKRAMTHRGTPYRKKTAVYASRLLNELVSSNTALPLTREALVQRAKSDFHLDDDQANDVAKNVLVQLARVKDRKRLANYYEEAEKRLRNQTRKK